MKIKISSCYNKLNFFKKLDPNARMPDGWLEEEQLTIPDLAGFLIFLLINYLLINYLNLYFCCFYFI
jgi:hypothetical protein